MSGALKTETKALASGEQSDETTPRTADPMNAVISKDALQAEIQREIDRAHAVLRERAVDPQHIIDHLAGELAACRRNAEIVGRCADRLRIVFHSLLHAEEHHLAGEAIEAMLTIANIERMLRETARGTEERIES